MVRNVMLERGVDIAVRQVRLGGNVPDFNTLRANICNNAGLIPDCMNSLQIEMQSVPIQPGGINSLQADARCIDRLSTDDPLTGTNFSIGGANQMMIVRACVLSKPLFPSTGLGVGLRVDSEGNYAMVATTAFVNEPNTRSIAAAPGS